MTQTTVQTRHAIIIREEIAAVKMTPVDIELVFS